MKTKLLRISAKYPMRTKHHLTPKSHFKRRRVTVDNSTSNVLLLRVERHYAWHSLFDKKNGQMRTLEEVIELLIRIHQRKQRCTKPLGACLLEKDFNGNKRQNGNSNKAVLSNKVQRLRRK